MNTSLNARNGSKANNTTDYTTCAAYIRTGVSGKVDDCLSVAQQKSRLEAFASEEGWTIYKWYEDEGFSGVTVERPALERLMADAEMHSFGRVVVLQVQILSPRADDLATLINKLRGLSIGVVSITQSLDTLDPLQWLVFTTLIQIVRSEEKMVAGHEPSQTSSTASPSRETRAERFLREILPEFIRLEKQLHAEDGPSPKPSQHSLDAERRFLQ
jgi:hypothetical protein